MLSVLMAAYNAARYLDEAIRSVLAQRGVAFELLVGDDGSTDGTWAVVSQYQGDPRVRAWRWAHRGAEVTRNALLAQARGRYVATFDADDLMLPGHLRGAARLLDHHRQVGVVYQDYWRCRGRTNGRWTRWAVPGPGETWDLLWGQGHPGTVMRRSLVTRLGGYRTDLPFMADYDLMLRLAEVTTFARRPGRLTFLKRQRPASLSDQPFLRWWKIAWHIRRAAIRRRYHHASPPWQH